MEQELSIIITFHQNGKQFCLIQTKIAKDMGRLINDIVKTKHCGNNCIIKYYIVIRCNFSISYFQTSIPL